MKKLFIFIILINYLLGVRAQSDTFAVLARKSTNCDFLTVDELNFGTYTGTETLTATASFSISCATNLTSLGMDLDGGTNGNGTTRFLTNGSRFLRYELYKDPNFTELWGDGINYGDTLSVPIVAGINNFFVYGKLPKDQSYNAGIYSDSVQIIFSLIDD